MGEHDRHFDINFNSTSVWKPSDGVGTLKWPSESWMGFEKDFLQRLLPKTTYDIIQVMVACITYEGTHLLI